MKILSQLKMLYVGMAALVLAIVGVWIMMPRPKDAAPPAPPPVSDFKNRVAGTGLVEAASENISVSNPVAGVIASVPVTAGQKVKSGELLFALDIRHLEAELQEREQDVAAAAAELSRLRSLPRPEDVPPAKARLAAADAVLADAQNKRDLLKGVSDPRAIRQEELQSRTFAVNEAEAHVAEARADLEKLIAGAWEPEIRLAEAKLESTKAAVQRVRTEIERHLIRAPIDGEVLKVNARPGEFAPANRIEDPMILIGNTDTLHIRVDIPEDLAWRVNADAPAVGAMRGRGDAAFDLRFVRFEPAVIPKRSLTGAPDERVDTRVLQVIYAMDAPVAGVFVGQQVDVFVESTMDAVSTNFGASK